MKDFIKNQARQYRDDRREFYGGMADRYRAGWEHLRDGGGSRDPCAPGAPDMSDFSQVLEHWCITEYQLPKVIRGLKLQIGSFVPVLFMGIYVIAASTTAATTFCGSTLIALSFGIFIMRGWRLWVLKNRKFVFFKHWIRGDTTFHPPKRWEPPVMDAEKTADNEPPVTETKGE